MLSRKGITQPNQEIFPLDIYEQAKTMWHLYVQRSLTNEKNIEETKKQLRVFRDSSGVLRVGGRLDNAPLPYKTKFPILLPRQHHVTRLLVMKCHEIVKHNGIKETLTQLRSELWIAKGRHVIKSILSKCVPRREIMGKAYNSPHTPPLPPFRVSDDAAYSQIGVDIAGPLYVRNMYGKEKQHLELTPDLQGTNFLRTLKRFIGRRGIPSRILSDYGKTLVDNTVQNYLHSKGIVWRFNIPKASWWGGLFEIMVKLTKRCLRKTLKSASLRYEELETVLIETEGILNSRPLTFVYEEITEPPYYTLFSRKCHRLLDAVDISKIPS